MSKLTKAEKEWITEVQEVLDRCPSKRLGFYTVGDPDVKVYDRSKEAKINDIHDKRHGLEFCGAVHEANADFGVQIDFPACVHSTAG